MTTSLTELIVSLRKLNPTFTDEIIRGHLINLGNTKEAVDDALRIVNGGNANDVLQNANRDMSKGVVFEEEVPHGSAASNNGYGNSAPFLGQKTVVIKSHKIRNLFISIFFFISSIIGLMFYLGSLKVDDFKNININWGQLTNVDYLKNESVSFLNTSSSKINLTYKMIMSKIGMGQTSIEPKVDGIPKTPLINKDQTFSVSEQIQKINKLKSVLNTYAGVYGGYPSQLSDLTKSGVGKILLPLLTNDDIKDGFTGKEFLYKTEPKAGFLLTYNMQIPKSAVKTKEFYDLVEYRLTYDSKTKKSSYVPFVKYTNGNNTATRDILSIEAMKFKITDSNKNLVPDSLE
jgi:hypothetical protein